MTEIVKHAAKKAKVHTVYKNSNGKRVPGTTTITGVMDKPALVSWANKIGLQGIQVREYVDELAAVGTLAHYMVECDLLKKQPDLSDYTPNQIDLAENALIKYYEWRKHMSLEVIGCEMELVSEAYQYGGTCDLYCKLDGIPTLIDIKTSKGVYSEHFTQVVGYRQLLIENGYDVDNVRILRIGRNEDEGFEDKPVTKIDLHWKRFVCCRNLYELNKQIGRV